jgi:hypothetical protein
MSIAEVDYSSASASASAPRQQPPPGHQISSPTDLRQGQVFTGYPAYPPSSAAGSSMAPSSYNPMDPLGRPGGAGTMISAPSSSIRETQNPLTDYVPESRKRKIEEVDDHHHSDRVRMGMQFNQDGNTISPSSYRNYPDFPRSSYPPQMPAPATAGQLKQFAFAEEEEPSTIVRTAVKVPMLEDSRGACAAAITGRPSERGSHHSNHPLRRDPGAPSRRRGGWSEPLGKFNSLCPIPKRLLTSQFTDIEQT